MAKILTKKLSISNLFNCEDITDFMNSIVQVMEFDGTSTNRFFLCEHNNIKFLVKVGFYKKSSMELYSKKISTTISHQDAEIGILDIFKKKIIDKNISSCIVELVYAKLCTNVTKLLPNGKRCENLVIGYVDESYEGEIDKILCNYIGLVKNGLAYNKLAFLVLERCNMTLRHFLQQSTITPIYIAIFKSLLFQIIHCIYALNKLYPKFRHYDLHTENVMLKIDTSYKYKITSPKFLIYTVEDVKYIIPYFGIIPKLIDFGFSSLPEEGIISNMTEDKLQMYTRADNDLLFLFYWILDSANESTEIDKILSQLEPNRAYIHYNANYIKKIESKIPTYSQMIKNNIWDEYKNYSIDNSQIHWEYTSL